MPQLKQSGWINKKFVTNDWRRHILAHMSDHLVDIKRYAFDKVRRSEDSPIPKEHIKDRLIVDLLALIFDLENLDIYTNVQLKYSALNKIIRCCDVIIKKYAEEEDKDVVLVVTQWLPALRKQASDFSLQQARIMSKKSSSSCYIWRMLGYCGKADVAKFAADESIAETLLPIEPIDLQFRMEGDDLDIPARNPC